MALESFPGILVRDAPWLLILGKVAIGWVEGWTGPGDSYLVCRIAGFS